MDCAFSSPFSTASPCTSLQNTFGKLRDRPHFSFCFEEYLSSASSSSSEDSEELFYSGNAVKKRKKPQKIIDSPTMIVPFMRHRTRSWDRDCPYYQKRSVSEESHRMNASQGNIFTRGLSRISRRKKKQKSLQSSLVSQQPSFDAPPVPSFQYTPPAEKSTILSKGMDRLRRSLRLHKRRDRSHDRHLSPDVTGGSKQEQWLPDEAAVRAGTCCFNVKYLGTVEVYESRGMQTCEGALKSLKAARRKPVKAVLYVSGDGLRVVDQGNSRGLLVDQTIEKVSFCAPDRMNEKGFAYICRDGASRRWMCHGFMATKETGERLSHAVGCAFSICLEKKKRRDEETITGGEATPTAPKKSDVFHPNWDEPRGEPSSSTTGNVGGNPTVPSTAPSSSQRANLAYQSFRKHVSIEDRYLDPQSVIINEVPATNHSDEIKRIAKPRPTSNPALFQRQGSLRAPDMPSSADQFKRNLSLRPGKGEEKREKKVIVHEVSTRARRGVASKVRAIKLAHSQARLRSYSQACERAAYIDGRCEFYPSLAFRYDQNTSGGVHDPEDLAELKRLMWQDFRDAGVDVNTTSPGYGYEINSGKVKIIPINIPVSVPDIPPERRSSCPSFGTQLYNQPIIESEEDLLGLGINVNIRPLASANPVHPTPATKPVLKSGLEGLDLNWKSVPAPIVGLNANGDFANWPTAEAPKVLSPLDRVQKQFDEFRLGSGSSGESTPTPAHTGFSLPPLTTATMATSSRSKADEWLDDVLRVSMSMSPTTASSSPNTPSSSYSILPKSGPPPTHAPPPLPVRQAVSNGSPSMFQNPSARDSPASNINWNSSPNPQQMASQIPKNNVDPFDIQWSKLTVNNTNV